MTMKQRRPIRCGNICLLLLGVILIKLGLLILIYSDLIYDYLLTQALALHPTSEAFQKWRINDPPLPMDIYLFNWTNPEDIHNASIKPRFEEIGPYRFREVKEKVNVTWNDNNTITYRHKKTYYFDANNSVRSLSDKITIIDVVPLSWAYQHRYSRSNWRYSFFLKSSFSLHVTKTAGEILFNGYEHIVLTMFSFFSSEIPDRFGFFYGRNGSLGADGIFNMWTKNDEDFGRLLTWNYRNTTDFYDGHCNQLRGSSGEFYPLNRKPDYLDFFSPELCRTAHLEFDRIETVNNVQGYKYTANNMFDNGTLVSENSCFCDDECLPSGVLNVSRCRNNSPTFLSLPHFYGADPYYTSSIEGMKPTKEEHEFYLIQEPKSGIAIDVGGRMQVNVLLQPIPSLSLYEDVPKVMMPIFYLDQKVVANEELTRILLLIQSFPEFCNILVLILISVGLILLLWLGLYLTCCSRSKVNHEDNSDTNKDTQHEVIPLRS